MDKIQTAHWENPNAYRERWSGRSAAMLDLCSAMIQSNALSTASEYGCGVYAPFSKEVDARSLSLAVRRYDIKAWDDDCRVCDFNLPDQTLENTDVAVMAGVCEYLNDIGNTFATLASHHKFLLVSYVYLPVQSAPAETGDSTESGYIDLLQHRVAKKGWRNHYTLPEFINTVSHFGYITNIAKGDRQVLLLAQRR